MQLSDKKRKSRLSLLGRLFLSRKVVILLNKKGFSESEKKLSLTDIPTERLEKALQLIEEEFSEELTVIEDPERNKKD